ncbi:DUF3951 domain-containing protein [Cohnella sp. GCM10027633]|uniref:DUF3951 domain-containing protein n=1 Tax=unclassified Cohnella TaxID=2636738 RepID=UPI003633E287
MAYLLFGIVLFSFLAILAWIGMIVIKIVGKRELPTANYAPFDHITGHSSVEFHEEKEEHEDEDDQGDDKDRLRYAHESK